MGKREFKISYKQGTSLVKLFSMYSTCALHCDDSYVNVVLARKWGGCYSVEEENGRGRIHMETPAVLNN